MCIQCSFEFQMASMTKSSQQDAVHSMFKLIDDNLTGELNACQVQAAHEMIRMGGISFQQVCLHFD